MGPTWKRDVYGTPEADTVKYDGLAVSAGEFVGTEKIPSQPNEPVGILVLRTCLQPLNKLKLLPPG